MYCYFYAIAHLPLAEAVLLNYSAPLFIPLAALLWVGEPFSHRLWWPIGIGFIGIALILKRGCRCLRRWRCSDWRPGYSRRWPWPASGGSRIPSRQPASCSISA